MFSAGLDIVAMYKFVCSTIKQNEYNQWPQGDLYVSVGWWLESLWREIAIHDDAEVCMRSRAQRGIDAPRNGTVYG
jgi:hypothetical protein